jgi:cytoskeletal protein CcmA (bactofilin family)
MFKRSNPTVQRVHPQREEPSYIARNTEFDGNLVCGGEIHIDGLVLGTVQAQTCLVDVNGEVHGGILAENVFIRGRVIGPVSASQVNIAAGAHVEGNVAHDAISIETGAYVLGNISHRSQAPVNGEESAGHGEFLNLPRGLLNGQGFPPPDEQS